ncbi:hypothetical protein ACFX11_030101 [Malus domestica]
MPAFTSTSTSASFFYQLPLFASLCLCFLVSLSHHHHTKFKFLIAFKVPTPSDSLSDPICSAISKTHKIFSCFLIDLSSKSATGAQRTPFSRFWRQP